MVAQSQVWWNLDIYQFKCKDTMPSVNTKSAGKCSSHKSLTGLGVYCHTKDIAPTHNRPHFYSPSHSCYQTEFRTLAQI